MPVERPGMNLQQDALIGLGELAHTRTIAFEVMALMLRAMTADYGLITGQHHGSAGLGWKVIFTIDGSLRILLGASNGINGLPDAATAIDRYGRILTFEPDTGERYRTLSEITVPDDGVYRTIVARYGHTSYEPGTLAFTAGDATVVGTGTKFTEFVGQDDLGAGVPGATRLVLSLSDSPGNAGRWKIKSITSDTELELEDVALANESGRRFKAGPEFYDEAGLPADTTGYRRPSCTFHLISRVVTPANADLVIADVMLDTAAGSTKVNVIDRRHVNRWRQVNDPRTGPFGCKLLMEPTPLDDNPTGTSPSEDIVPPGIHTRPVLSVSNLIPQSIAVACGRAKRIDVGLICAMTFTTGNTIRICEYMQNRDTWYNNGNTVGTSITLGSAPSDVVLVAAPLGLRRATAALNITQFMFYKRDGKLYRADLYDDGVFNAEVLVWDYTAASVTFNGYDVLLTRWGRLICVFSKGTAGLYSIYSDDYGVTWATNSGAGFEILTSGGTKGTPALAEGDDGRLTIAYLYNNTVTSGYAIGLIRATSPTNGTPTPVIVEGMYELPAYPQTVNPEDDSSGLSDIRQVRLLPLTGGAYALITENYLSGTYKRILAAVVSPWLVRYNASLMSAATLELRRVWRLGAGANANVCALGACLGPTGAIELVAVQNEVDRGYVGHMTLTPVLTAAPLNPDLGLGALDDDLA